MFLGELRAPSFSGKLAARRGKTGSVGGHRTGLPSSSTGCSSSIAGEFISFLEALATSHAPFIRH